MLHVKEWTLIIWPHQKQADLNWGHKIVENFPASGDETSMA